MYNFKIFKHQKLEMEIETLIIDKVIYFNLNSVAKALEISNPRKVTKDWLNVYKIKFTNKQLCKISDVANSYNRNLNNRGETFLTEAGLNKMIFKSRKPKAELIQDWIFIDVLPQIRKNGFYISPESLVNPSKKLIRFSSSIMQTRKATILKRDKLYSRIEKFLDSETGYKENSLNRVVSTVYQHLHIATSLKTAVLVIQDNLINSKDGLKINSYNPKQKKPYDKDYIVAMNYYNEKQLKLFDSYFLGILEDVIKHLDSPHTLPTSKSVIKILKDSGIRQIKLVTELDLGTTFQGKVRTEIDELVDEYKKEKMEYLEMVKKLEKLRTGKIFKI